MKSFFKLTILIFLSVFLSYSCNKENKTQNRQNTNTANIRKKDETFAKRVSLNDAKYLIDNKTKNRLNIIDVRTPEEYREYHIKDSVNINYNDNFKYHISKLNKNKKYLIYCRTGHRSSEALKIMKSLGFKYVYEMEKGIKGWKEKGWNVVKL